jgi:AP2 domain
MKTIRLTRGLVTLVDNEDYARFGHLKWYAQRGFNTYYAARKDRSGYVFLHQAIMGVRGVDHRNGVGLDNRRENLRISSQSQNDANCVHKNNTTGFKGVVAVPRHKTKPWKAEIKQNGKRYHLGYFATREQAAAAYRRKAVELYGEFARFEPVALDPVLAFLQGAYAAKQRDRTANGATEGEA